MENNLNRFLRAQQGVYDQALKEIRMGMKRSHWMWYVFPQIKGLGKSETAKYYGIIDLNEAAAYLRNQVLGHRLIEISSVLNEITGKTAYEIFGTPDDMKLRSCMTLFATLKDSPAVFEDILNRFFNGLADELTLQIISKIKS